MAASPPAGASPAPAAATPPSPSTGTNATPVDASPPAPNVASPPPPLPVVAPSSPPPPVASSPPPAGAPPPVTLSPPPPQPPPAVSPPPLPPPPVAALSPPPPQLPPPVLTPSPPNSPPPVASSPPPPSTAAPPPAPALPPPTLQPPKPSPSQPFSPPPPNSDTPPAIESPPPAAPLPTQPAAPPKNNPPSTPVAPAPKLLPSLTPPSTSSNSSSTNSSSRGSAASPSTLPASAVDPGNPILPRDPGSNKSGSPGNSGASSSSNAGLNAGAIAGVSVLVVLLVLSLVGAVVWYRRKRRQVKDGYKAGFASSSSPSPFSSPVQLLGDSANQRASFVPTSYTNYNHSSGSHGYKASMSEIGNSSFFTYDELHEITDGFASRNLLGEGGFGCVYKGRLPDGRQVAVKQLKFGGGQGEREFHAEVDIISRVHHRHLVSLVGYCIADHQRLLVYDFVPNNTLYYHLHGEGRPVLEWSIRVRIASGAARGIAYLHEDCHPRIIHRDIKSSNILLDDNFEAQVADFGLARLAMDAVTHITTRVMGTFGYLAPEYASSGKLTERSDVYSFGVVLLELISGRKPVDASNPAGEESLVEWARPLLSQAIETGNLDLVADPRLEKNYNEMEMFRMMEAAAASIRYSASRRPRMSQVVRALDSLTDEDLSNGVQPGKSEMFNMANTAQIRMFQRMAFGGQDGSSLEFSQSSWNSRRDYDASGAP